MPNWKAPESSVRLLSAIIAAHPELKLNYAEVGKFYGGATTYKSIWGRMTQINNYAKTLQAAVMNGQDPLEVALVETALAPKSKTAMSARFGGDCTHSSLENRFRRIKQDAKAMNDALKNGIDPITLDIGDVKATAGTPRPEIAEYYGSEATKSSFLNVFNRNINKNAKKLKAARSTGKDPQSEELIMLGVSGKISRAYGQGVTKKSISNIFDRGLSNNVHAIRRALEMGDDPGDLSLRLLGGGRTEMAKCLDSNTTAKALSHVFCRFVNPNVRAIRAAVQAGTNPADAPVLGLGGGNEIALNMGTDTTASGLRWQFAVPLKANVKLIKAARATGSDCKLLTLGTGGGRAIAGYMGSDTTSSAVSWQFCYPLKSNVQLLKTAFDNGQDCKDVILGMGGRGQRAKEIKQYMGSDTTKSAVQTISRVFGSDCTANGLRFQFTDRFRPLAKRQLAMLDSGLDPKDVDLTEISRMFGNDSTAGGIGFQFRSIKHAAQARRDWVEAGKNAQDLPAGAIAAMLNDGTTKYALDHKFRPIKKMAQEMKAAAGTATPTVKTPGSRKRTPATKKSSKKATVSDEEDDDEASMDESPSKGKGSINRVKTGRVTKPARATASKVNYVESADEDDAMMATDSHPIKSEPGFAVQTSKNGYNGFSASDSYGDAYQHNGFGNGQQGEETEEFFGAVEEFEDA